MALFGSDMADVVTPDGRRITVPSQLAQAFPGLQPFVPPEVAQPPELPVAPPFVPQPSDALSSPQPEPPAAPQPAQPATAPEPQQPVVKPVTNAQLAKMGPAGAANVELEAQTAQRAAVEQQGKALADQATAIGTEMEAVNAEAARQLQARQQYAEQRAADLQSATDALTREAKSISDVRVDRSVDHPVLAALSAALIGVGQAMNKQPIDAMSAVYKAIDRKVAGQMAELDNRRANYAMSKDALGIQRQAGRDRLDEMDAHRLAYLDQAKRQLEEIKQKTSSDVIRGQTSVLQAEIDRKSAETVSVAQQRFEQRQQQKEMLAEQAASRRQSAAQFQQTFAENVRQFNVREDNDLRQAMLAARAKGDEIKAKKIADAMKENETRGIGDPGNGGKRFLQPEGVALEKQAVAADAEAQKFAQAAQGEKDPAKRQALETRARASSDRATDLRAEIAINPNATWRLGSPEIADKMALQVGATQTIANAVDEIKVLRKNNGAKWLFSTEGEAWMQSKGAQLSVALKDAWNLGVLSSQDFELINNASGGDPTKLTPGDFIKILDIAEGTTSRLESLAQGVENSTRNNMRARGFNGEYKVKRDPLAKQTPEEEATVDALRSETPVEKAAQQERGLVGKAAEAVLNPLGERPADRRARAAEESGSTSYPGLSDTQATAVDANLKALAKGGDKAKRAADTLVSLATDSSRPALQNAMLTTLKERAPDLYQQALGRLPAQDAGDATAAPTVNQASIASRSEAIGSAQPIALLQKLSIDGDPAARAELARRAVAGDTDAVKAIQQIMRSRSSWRPTGAVQ